MRDKRIWRWMAGVECAVVKFVEVDDADGSPAMIVGVRVYADDRDRCGRCGARSPRFDNGEGPRRWRAPDLGTVQCFIEADAPRVKCAEHGVVVARVPWARHDCRFTRPFEDQVAWLVTQTDKTTVSELFRVTWRTVDGIMTRVAAEAEAKTDRFAGVTRIGIDEVSYRKGHRYLVVVADHDTGRLLWAAPGRDEATLNGFFDQLGEERNKAIKLVSCDAATWIANAVRKRCPQATICLDPFHVVQWATDALDEVRRDAWNDARRSGRRVLAKVFKKARYALWKNPEDLTEGQQGKLSEIARTSKPVYRAYLLKEALREVFQLKGEPGKSALDEFLAWASRSRLKPFVKLGRSIRAHLESIHAVLEHCLTNARIEALNGKLRLITRIAFGFHSHEPLIALAMLRLGGLRPKLPGRS